MKTIVIIPAYNEELNIEKTIEDVKKNAPYVDYIVINDGSRDDTLSILEKHHYSYINGVCNLGLFGAVQTGFRFAIENQYDCAIQFDGDGQHSAKYIRYMLDEIQNGNDIVIGSRFVTDKKPFTIRMIGSRLISIAIRLVTGKIITDPTSGFRAYSRNCIFDYAMDSNNPPEPDTLVYMLRKGK